MSALWDEVCKGSGTPARVAAAVAVAAFCAYRRRRRRTSSSLLDIECLRLPGLPFGSARRFRSLMLVLGVLVVSFRSWLQFLLSQERLLELWLGCLGAQLGCSGKRWGCLGGRSDLVVTFGLGC